MGITDGTNTNTSNRVVRRDSKTAVYVGYLDLVVECLCSSYARAVSRMKNLPVPVPVVGVNGTAETTPGFYSVC